MSSQLTLNHLPRQNTLSCMVAHTMMQPPRQHWETFLKCLRLSNRAKGGMGLVNFRKLACWNYNVVTGFIRRIYFHALGLWPNELENICLCPLLKLYIKVTSFIKNARFTYWNIWHTSACLIVKTFLKNWCRKDFFCLRMHGQNFSQENIFFVNCGNRTVYILPLYNLLNNTANIMELKKYLDKYNALQMTDFWIFSCMLTMPFSLLTRPSSCSLV